MPPPRWPPRRSPRRSPPLRRRQPLRRRRPLPRLRWPHRPHPQRQLVRHAPETDLDCTTITQAQTQTPRTVRGLRTPRTLPSACAADPNKSTFTVTLKTPDGDIVFECPPEQYVLDEAEEQELEGADELPYACRAGSCSACTGKVARLAPPPRPSSTPACSCAPRQPKPLESAPPASPQIVSGTMDVSGCGFLEEDQKAAGFVLTCTPAGAIPARASSGASATAPPRPPHGRLPQGSVGLVCGSAGLAFRTARRAWTPQSRAFFTCRHGQAHFGRRD